MFKYNAKDPLCSTIILHVLQRHLPPPISLMCKEHDLTLTCHSHKTWKNLNLLSNFSNKNWGRYFPTQASVDCATCSNRRVCYVTVIHKETQNMSFHIEAIFKSAGKLDRVTTIPCFGWNLTSFQNFLPSNYSKLQNASINISWNLMIGMYMFRLKVFIFAISNLSWCEFSSETLTIEYLVCICMDYLSCEFVYFTFIFFAYPFKCLII